MEFDAKELTMLTSIRMDKGQLRSEEMNRARQEVQSRWTQAERWHRRQLAECRQQALARILSLTPVDKSRAPQSA
jgi:hypothetical protein